MDQSQQTTNKGSTRTQANVFPGAGRHESKNFPIQKTFKPPLILDAEPKLLMGRPPIPAKDYIQSRSLLVLDYERKS